MRCWLILFTAFGFAIEWQEPLRADEESDKAAVLAGWQEWVDSFESLRIKARWTSRVQLESRWPELAALSEEEFRARWYNEEELIVTKKSEHRLTTTRCEDGKLSDVRVSVSRRDECFVAGYSRDQDQQLRLKSLWVGEPDNPFGADGGRGARAIQYFWWRNSNTSMQQAVLNNPSGFRCKQSEPSDPANIVRAEWLIDGSELYEELWLDRDHQYFPRRIESWRTGKSECELRWEFDGLTRHPVSNTAMASHGIESDPRDMSHVYTWEIVEFDTNLPTENLFKTPVPENGVQVTDRDGKSRVQGVTDDDIRRKNALELQAAIQQAKQAEPALPTGPGLPIAATPNSQMVLWPVGAAGVAIIAIGLFLRSRWTS